MRAHLGLAHPIRRFAINRHFSDNLSTSPFEPYEDLANELRNTMAKTIAISPYSLHCTLKLVNDCGATKKEDWRVYTIARSSQDSNRPQEFKPTYHLIGNNSSFAATVGCTDRLNTWSPNNYVCFTCNDLTKHANYDCSRTNWINYFRSTIVFPLKIRRGRHTDFEVGGFLTFDSKKLNVFGRIPDIFDYMGKDVEYREKADDSMVFHIGGLMADILATTLFLQEDIRKENNAK